MARNLPWASAVAAACAVPAPISRREESWRRGWGVGVPLAGTGGPRGPRRPRPWASPGPAPAKERRGYTRTPRWAGRAGRAGGAPPGAAGQRGDGEDDDDGEEGARARPVAARVSMGPGMRMGRAGRTAKESTGVRTLTTRGHVSCAGGEGWRGKGAVAEGRGAHVRAQYS